MSKTSKPSFKLNSKGKIIVAPDHIEFRSTLIRKDGRRLKSRAFPIFTDVIKSGASVLPGETYLIEIVRNRKVLGSFSLDGSVPASIMLGHPKKNRKECSALELGWIAHLKALNTAILNRASTVDVPAPTAQPQPVAAAAPEDRTQPIAAVTPDAVLVAA